MTKPKTLGEMLDADRANNTLTPKWGLYISVWLNLHGMENATPLEVEEIGVLEDIADHGQAAVMAFRVGDRLWQHMEDCAGRTVALLTEPLAAKSSEIDGNG